MPCQHEVKSGDYLNWTCQLCGFVGGTHLSEIKDRTIHDKLRVRYQSLVENRLADDDRADSFEVEFGVVYRCQELRCSHLPSHGHRRRPYIVWDRI